jgi:hypothetical protein
MSFDDEKFLGIWGAVFCGILTLINFKFIPDFLWREYLGIEAILAAYAFLKFQKNFAASKAFYKMLLIIWATLFVGFSGFSLFLIFIALGRLWLSVLAPCWALLTIILIRATINLNDGSGSTQTRAISWLSACGASFSGLLTLWMSNANIIFTLTLIIDMLFSFVSAAYSIVWLRRLLNSKVRAS